MLDDEPEYRLPTEEIFHQKWFTSGEILKPESISRSTGAKYHRDNCGIAVPPLHKSFKEVEAYIVESTRRHQSSRPFFTKLSERIASAVVPKRNASH